MDEITSRIGHVAKGLESEYWHDLSWVLELLGLSRGGHHEETSGVVRTR